MPGQFNLTGQIFLYLTAATLKRLVEFQNKKNSIPLFIIIFKPKCWFQDFSPLILWVLVGVSGNHVSFVAELSLLSRGNRISHHLRSQDSLLLPLISWVLGGVSGNHVSFVAHHSLLSRGNRISHHSRSQDSLLSDFSVKDAFSSVDVMQKDDISLRQKTEWGLAVCILK